MDFLSIRKKARERAEAREAADAGPEPSAEGGALRSEPGDRAPGPPQPRPPPPPEPREPPPAPRFEERRRNRGGERVLTDADLVEGALQARLQGLEPTVDGRFATWRPGAGPPPLEPDAHVFERPPGRAAGEEIEARAPAPANPLDTFFYRPDEEAGIVPVLGGASVEEPVAPASTALDEFLTFLLGTEELAVPIAQVREVLRAPAITEVPRAPAHVLGIVTVRGEVVVVIDTRARLGLGDGSGSGTRIVIVDAGEGPLGLLVDQVSSVVRLPRGSLEPCPQGISAAASDCVTGIGRWRDRLFLVIDVAMLFGHSRPAEER